MEITENEICANCGNVLFYCRKTYRLNNEDFVCSKKCLKEYALDYFSDYKEIK